MTNTPSDDVAELIEALRTYRTMTKGGHPSICDEAADMLSRLSSPKVVEDAVKALRDLKPARRRWINREAAIEALTAALSTIPGDG